MNISRELGRVSVNLRITEIENGYVVETIGADVHLGPKFIPTPGLVSDYCGGLLSDWVNREIADAKE